MRQHTVTAMAMMMEMCMCICDMRMTFCAYLSDVLSISDVNSCIA